MEIRITAKQRRRVCRTLILYGLSKRTRRQKMRRMRKLGRLQGGFIKLHNKAIRPMEGTDLLYLKTI